MKNFKVVRLMMVAAVLLISMSAFAAKPIGPVGDTSRHQINTVIALDGPAAPTGPVNAQQCWHWKLGDKSDS
ncbi:MAG: hypothetical protein QOE82_3703, partial [Thermoanaerobaculia bacterium]|nr:hypothetical protein [Thermoanaerobaculia bacterium]